MLENARPILLFLAYVGTLIVVAPLLGAAIMHKALERVGYRDASYGQLAQVYFGACCASYVLVVPVNYLAVGPWQTVLQWIVIVGTQMIYLPVVLGWTTKKQVPRPTIWVIGASVLVTNVLIAATIYLFLVDSTQSAGSA